MIRDRASDAFTRYDGNLTNVEGLPDYLHDGGAISPTALESYASCPHAFFARRLLGVEPIEQPEDIIEISPADAGSLVHEAMDALIKRLGDDLPGHGQPWTLAQRAELVSIAERVAGDFLARGLTGHPRLWEGERRRILTDLAWMLDDDDEWRATVRARVAASEMPFGMKGHDPVEIVVPGGRILMRGSADKVDLGHDGTIYVTDIKTGSRRTFKEISQDDPVVGGTKLQLPVYAHAARREYGDRASDVRSAYWFVRKDRGRLELELTSDVETTVAETLAVLARSIASGLFPPKAPEQPDFAWVQCAYCNPDGIGHADNRDRWVRKRQDPTLTELVALVDAGAATRAEAEA
jgi:ATP-dependent helicase/DNAse subunit B